MNSRPILLAGYFCFRVEGGGIVLLGMIISIIAVALCGRAGFLKEKNIFSDSEKKGTNFNMKKGLILTLIAGTLLAVWGIS